MFAEAALPPRSPGPPLHVHTREDEAVYVIDGVLTVRVGERTFEAGPQTLVWLPRGEPHAFANLSAEPVRAFGLATPAGLEGMFSEQANYSAGLVGAADPAALTAIATRYGVTVLGPGLS
ncbi:MAG: Cupin 2 conserved barrel domain protein [Frankiales bacterium]|nr:Cupin 2 conserved barrel domain protein [Frankiales bacterium]